MEVTFSQLKQKDVISITDGKHLGKVCDLSFCFPENVLLGFFVTGCKGFKLTRQDMFIPIKQVQKIGEDAVLVKLESEKDKCPPKQPPKRDNCPPPKHDNCPPPDACRPEFRPDCRPCAPDRRSYEEYE